MAVCEKIPKTKINDNPIICSTINPDKIESNGIVIKLIKNKLPNNSEITHPPGVIGRSFGIDTTTLVKITINMLISKPINLKIRINFIMSNIQIIKDRRKLPIACILFVVNSSLFAKKLSKNRFTFLCNVE
jgi:hypothetical protein